MTAALAKATSSVLIRIVCLRCAVWEVGLHSALRISARPMPRGASGPRSRIIDPPITNSDDGYQHGRQPLSETKAILPIGFVSVEAAPAGGSVSNARAVLAHELVGVQSHLGRERSHVPPSEHSTGKAGEVVVLNGPERGHRDLRGRRDVPKGQPSLLARLPEAGTDIRGHLFHVTTSVNETPLDYARRPSCGTGAPCAGSMAGSRASSDARTRGRLSG